VYVSHIHWHLPVDITYGGQCWPCGSTVLLQGDRPKISCGIGVGYRKAWFWHKCKSWLEIEMLCSLWSTYHWYFRYQKKISDIIRHHTVFFATAWLSCMTLCQFVDVCTRQLLNSCLWFRQFSPLCWPNNMLKCLSRVNCIENSANPTQLAILLQCRNMWECEYTEWTTM